jgi:hypothetical protein
MSSGKEIKNTQVGSLPTGANFNKLAEEVMFSPAPAQKRLKAKFWARYVPGPLTDIDSLSLEDVAEIVRDARIKTNWSISGFREWFLNRDENRERLEYIFTLGLDAAEEILTNPEANPASKVNMLKVIGELAAKFPNKWQQERFVDDEINKMSEFQLKAWLERRGISEKSVNSIPEVIDAKYTEDKSTEDTQTTSEEDKDSR